MTAWEITKNGAKPCQAVHTHYDGVKRTEATTQRDNVCVLTSLRSIIPKNFFMYPILTRFLPAL